MIKKIIKAIKNPVYTFRFVFNVFRRRFMIHRIEQDGKVFFKYKGVLYPEHLFRKKASAYINEKALLYCKGNGIDVGAGAWPLKGAYAIEDNPHENAYKLNRFEENSLDFVFSSHCVEHLDRWPEAIGLWIDKLKSGGVLFIYVPHESMVLWRPGEAMGLQHVWSPTYKVLNPWLEKHNMRIVEFEPKHDQYWSFHIVAKKI
jgi:SAM-dependent methyltransferase